MSNKVKDINIKTHTYYFFSMALSVYKILIQIILESMKGHTKIFLFTILDMWRSKIWNS